MRWLGQQIEQRSKLVPSTDDDTSGSWAKHDSLPSPSSEAAMDGSEDDLQPELAAQTRGPPLIHDEAVHARESPGAASPYETETSSSAAANLHGREESGQEESMTGSRVVIGQGLASPESSFGRSWSIRWLQHLQGFGDRRQVSGRRPGSRNPRRPTWVQSTSRILTRLFLLVLTDFPTKEPSFTYRS